MRNMGRYRIENVDPDELRFTQDSIASYLRHGDDQVLLKENLKMLISGELQADVFPLLKVFRDEDGVLWSNDNRRLWLFRKAKVQQIKVKVFIEPFNRAPPEIKEDRDRMSKRDYFPKVRGELEPADPEATQHSPNGGEYKSKSAVPTNMVPTIVIENPEITEEVFSKPISPRSDGDRTPMDTMFREIEVNPNELRFTQSSIDPYLTTPVRGESEPADPEATQHSPNGGEYKSKSAVPTNMVPTIVIENPEITEEVFSNPISPRSDGDRTPMDTTFREIEVNPNELRFTQSSIDPYLTHPSGQKLLLERFLQVILQMLKSNQLNPEVSSLFDEFPPLEVCRDEGVLWCEDNERLWLFRKAGIPQIRVKLFNKPLSRAPPKMKADQDRMSKSDFFPTIRGQSPEIMSPPTSGGNDGFWSRWASTSTQLMEDGSQALLIGVAATASGLFMGFGIVPSVVLGFAGWKMSKHMRS